MPATKKKPMWTDSEKIKIRRIIRAGGTLDDIAAILAVPIQHDTIINRLKRDLGITYHRNRRAHDGNTALAYPQYERKTNHALPMDRDHAG